MAKARMIKLFGTGTGSCTIDDKVYTYCFDNLIIGWDAWGDFRICWRGQDILTISNKRVGGIRFVGVNRLRFSFCVAKR